MTQMVQVAVAGDVTEAEEIQEILRSAGIKAQLGDGEDDSHRARNDPNGHG